MFITDGMRAKANWKMRAVPDKTFAPQLVTEQDVQQSLSRVQEHQENKELHRPRTPGK
jgi:hypothetical protein